MIAHEPLAAAQEGYVPQRPRLVLMRQVSFRRAIIEMLEPHQHSRYAITPRVCSKWSSPRRPRNTDAHVVDYMNRRKHKVRRQRAGGTLLATERTNARHSASRPASRLCAFCADGVDGRVQCADPCTLCRRCPPDPCSRRWPGPRPLHLPPSLQATSTMRRYGRLGANCCPTNTCPQRSVCLAHGGASRRRRRQRAGHASSDCTIASIACELSPERLPEQAAGLRLIAVPAASQRVRAKHPAEPSARRGRNHHIGTARTPAAAHEPSIILPPPPPFTALAAPSRWSG